MSYEDPFIVIDPVGQSWLDMGWTEEDFKWAVLELEKMPKEKLVKVLKDKDVQISFGDAEENDSWEWETETPKEEMATALMHDVTPEKIKELIKRYA